MTILRDIEGDDPGVCDKALASRAKDAKKILTLRSSMIGSSPRH